MERKQYKKITYQDRKTIEQLIRAGKDATAIAAAVGVHYGTIMRELKRGGDPYKADVAQRSL